MTEAALNWDGVYSSTATPKETTEVLTSAAEELDRFLSEVPDASESVNGLLSARLRDPMTVFTYTGVSSALIDYLGYNPGSLLLWIAVDQDSRVSGVSTYGSRPVAIFVRNLFNRHGPRFEMAYLISSRVAHDWHRIDRQIVFDHERNQYTFSIRLLKNNGDEIPLEMAANSMLSLISILFGFVRDHPTRDAFSDAQLEDFLREAEETVRFLRPPAEKKKPVAAH